MSFLDNMVKGIDLKNSRFGRWKVIEFAGIFGRQRKYWKCKCDCGTIKDVLQDALTNGRSQSCGCYHSDMMTQSPLRLKHGHRQKGKISKEYRAWRSMIQRCSNLKIKQWNDYGGRGIKVCDRWQGKDGFTNFLKDMEECPFAEYSLDRIDNNGDYSPENCHWTNKHNQDRNRRNNVWITINGETLVISDWAAKTGVSICTIRWRLKKGWTGEALIRPVPARNQK